MKRLTFLDRTGDGLIEWDDESGVEVLEKAEAKFNELKDQGYTFVETETEGDATVIKANSVVNEFKDIKDNTEIFALPRTAGG